MILRYKACTLILILLAVINLAAVVIPLQLDWWNSQSYKFFPGDDDSSAGWDNFYKLKAAVDTTFSNGLRARLALTNQEQRLASQVIIDEALLDFVCRQTAMRFSVCDFGFGKDFFFYNRRTADKLHKRNALTELRWQGVNIAQSFGETTSRIGLGGNSLNRFLAEYDFQYKGDALGLQLYGIYVHNDSHYSVHMFNAGYDATAVLKHLRFHFAGECSYYIKSGVYPQMDNWHAVSEISYNPINSFSLIISSDLKTTPTSTDIQDMNEICLQHSLKRVVGMIGYRTQSLPGERAHTGFFDLDYSPHKDISVGFFFDYNDLTQSRDYSQAGIQTTFRMR